MLLSCYPSAVAVAAVTASVGVVVVGIGSSPIIINAVPVAVVAVVVTVGVAASVYTAQLSVRFLHLSTPLSCQIAALHPHLTHNCRGWPAPKIESIARVSFHNGMSGHLVRMTGCGLRTVRLRPFSPPFILSVSPKVGPMRWKLKRLVLPDIQHSPTSSEWRTGNGSAARTAMFNFHQGVH